jgi:hypothetical protein
MAFFDNRIDEFCPMLRGKSDLSLSYHIPVLKNLGVGMRIHLMQKNVVTRLTLTDGRTPLLQKITRITQTDVLAHPAVKGWKALQPEHLENVGFGGWRGVSSRADGAQGMVRRSQGVGVC